MNYSTFEEAVKQGHWPMEIDVQSVYRAFEQVLDGRHKRGVCYQVEEILTLILLGKLAGMTTPAAIAEWVRHRADHLKQLLPWKRPTFPCASTYSNVLRTLDAAHLTEVLAQFLTRAEASLRCGEEPSRLATDAQGQIHAHLALDGKTLRGTLGHEAEDQNKMHQLAFYEVQTGVVFSAATDAPTPLVFGRE